MFNSSKNHLFMAKQVLILKNDKVILYMQTFIESNNLCLQVQQM